MADRGRGGPGPGPSGRGRSSGRGPAGRGQKNRRQDSSQSSGSSQHLSGELFGHPSPDRGEYQGGPPGGQSLVFGSFDPSANTTPEPRARSAHDPRQQNGYAAPHNGYGRGAAAALPGHLPVYGQQHQQHQQQRPPYYPGMAGYGYGYTPQMFGQYAPPMQNLNFMAPQPPRTPHYPQPAQQDKHMQAQQPQPQPQQHHAPHHQQHRAQQAQHMQPGQQHHPHQPQHQPQQHAAPPRVSRAIPILDPKTLPDPPKRSTPAKGSKPATQPPTPEQSFSQRPSTSSSEPSGKLLAEPPNLEKSQAPPAPAPAPPSSAAAAPAGEAAGAQQQAGKAGQQATSSQAGSAAESSAPAQPPQQQASAAAAAEPSAPADKAEPAAPSTEAEQLAPADEGAKSDDVKASEDESRQPADILDVAATQGEDDASSAPGKAGVLPAFTRSAEPESQAAPSSEPASTGRAAAAAEQDHSAPGQARSKAQAPPQTTVADPKDTESPVIPAAPAADSNTFAELADPSTSGAVEEGPQEAAPASETRQSSHAESRSHSETKTSTQTTREGPQEAAPALETRQSSHAESRSHPESKTSTQTHTGAAQPSSAPKAADAELAAEGRDAEEPPMKAAQPKLAEAAAAAAQEADQEAAAPFKVDPEPVKPESVEPEPEQASEQLSEGAPVPVLAGAAQSEAALTAQPQPGPAVDAEQELNPSPAALAAAQPSAAAQAKAEQGGPSQPDQASESTIQAPPADEAKPEAGQSQPEEPAAPAAEPSAIAVKAALQEADAAAAQLRQEKEAGAADQGKPAEAAKPGLSARNKRKMAMAKADRATQGDLLDAYKEKKPEEVPEDLPEPDTAPEKPESSSHKEQEEDDDWETKAETLQAPGMANGANSKRVRYSMDYMKRLRGEPQCHEEPRIEGVSRRLLQDPNDRGLGPGMDPRQQGQFGGRGGGRGGPMGGPGGDDRWAKGRGAPMPGMGPGRGGPGMPGPGRGGPGPGQRGGIESRQWARGTAAAQGHGGGGQWQSQIPASALLHKTEKRYERGQYHTSDPVEEQRQRDFKSLLNKITPEKFDVIKVKLVEVGIEDARTLTGLIDQVFDKALSEPTFSALYAQLCHFLSSELPDFTEADPETGEPKKVTFRRIILNKCQSEFEKGAEAMAAVEGREQKAKERGEDGKDDKEEGEIPNLEADRLQAKKDADEEFKARKRSLGNIRFIGFLFVQKLLSEKIMHTCIQQLLQSDDAPRAEDVECLAQLLRTVGAYLDPQPPRVPAGRHHRQQQQQPASQQAFYMDAYFRRIETMSKGSKLDSRLRFMLQDVIDLRFNAWVERRAVEGPKTISEIHRDAAQEAMRKASSGRDFGRDRGGFGRDRGPPPMMQQPPPQRRMQEERIEAPRVMARSASNDYLGPQGQGVSLRPGGGPAAGLGRGGPSRDASPSMAGRGMGGPPQARELPGPPSRSSSGAAPAPGGPTMSDAELKRMAGSRLQSLFTGEDVVDEILDFFKDAQASGISLAKVIQTMLRELFSVRGAKYDAFVGLLQTLAERKALQEPDVQPAFKGVFSQLEDIADDAPKSPEVLGRCLGALLVKGAVSPTGALSAVLEASGEGFDDEPGERLIEGPNANSLLKALFGEWRAGSGQEAVQTAWQSKLLSLVNKEAPDQAVMVENLVNA